MDEEEIDAWYEEEKQKCMDDYLKGIEESKNHEAAEKRYKERLGKAIDKYNKLMEDAIKGRKSGIKSVISNIKKAVSSYRGK